MSNLKKIEKKSAEIYLAADDGALVYDDTGEKYIVVKLKENLTKIKKSDR